MQQQQQLIQEQQSRIAGYEQQLVLQEAAYEQQQQQHSVQLSKLAQFESAQAKLLGPPKLAAWPAVRTLAPPLPSGSKPQQPAPSDVSLRKLAQVMEELTRSQEQTAAAKAAAHDSAHRAAEFRSELSACRVQLRNMNAPEKKVPVPTVSCWLAIGDPLRALARLATM